MTKFERGTVTNALPVAIVGGYDTAADYKEYLYEVFGRDVLAGIKGTIEINGYKTKCFVYGSKKINYLEAENYLTAEFSIVTDSPQWRTEDTVSFSPMSSVSIVGYDRDYYGDTAADEMDRRFPYGYIYDQSATVQINNRTFAESGFILTIYGGC